MEGNAVRQAVTTSARVRLRRVTALITGSLLLFTCIGAGTSHATGSAAVATGSAAVTSGAQHSASKSPARPATASGAADLAVTSLTPSAPDEDDILTLSGTVTNRGRSPITRSTVGLRLGRGGEPLNSRSNLAAIVRRGPYETVDGPQEPAHTQGLPPIPSGVSRSFTLKVPIEELDLGKNGVYQLSVSLVGRTKAAPFNRVLGIERTFLPWYPEPDDIERTKIAMAWPLIGRPHMDARTDSDPQQTPVFRDDELTAELAPGGRLQQLVAIGKNLPVTWVIDPDLLATVDAMAEGYRVANDGTLNIQEAVTGEGTPGGVAARNTRPGAGSDLAKTWLGELKEAVANAPVVALPFGDPDLASIAHQGRNVPGTLAHLKSATELAALTTETVLSVRPRTDVAWPVAGALDRSLVNVARAGGADTVIASSSSLGSRGLKHTPNAVRPIGGGTTALVADDALSEAFSGDLSRAGNNTAAVQRFLAETLMITLESPGRQRNILVAPQREPSASAAQAMARALETAQDRGWTAPGTLEDIESAKPDRGAGHTVPGRRGYPDRLRAQELSTSAFRQVQQTQSELQGFVVILSSKDRVTIPFGTTILRSMSTSWRRDLSEASRYRDALHSYLAALRELVHIVQKSPTTLSGNSGTIQVTVENNLAQEVTLRLHLASDLPYRFQVDSEEGQQTVTIGGERKKTLKFPTSATANGRVAVSARLYTLDGTPYGEEMRFQVNVTSVTGTVLAVIACGMLLLVLAGARMYRQRKQAVRHGENGEEPPGHDSGGYGQGGEANAEDTGVGPLGREVARSPGGTAGEEPVDGEAADAPGVGSGQDGTDSTERAGNQKHIKITGDQGSEDKVIDDNRHSTSRDASPAIPRDTSAPVAEPVTDQPSDSSTDTTPMSTERVTADEKVER